MRRRVLEWAWVVPDIGENRARYAADPNDPEVVQAELRGPSEGAWRRYQTAVAFRAIRDRSEQAAPVVELDDAIEGPLFLACSRGLRGYVLESTDGDIPVETCADLWARRAEIEAVKEGEGGRESLVTALFAAILDKATLTEGLASRLASASGSANSPAATAGTAPSAERTAST